MKIIGVSASPRKKQSTYFALEQCLDEVKLASEASGKSIDIEIIDLAGLKINGCVSCDACKKDLLCSQKDDFQLLIAGPGECRSSFATEIKGCQEAKSP